MKLFRAATQQRHLHTRKQNPEWFPLFPTWKEVKNEKNKPKKIRWRGEEALKARLVLKDGCAASGDKGTINKSPQCSEPGTQSWPGNPPQFLPKKIAQKRLQRVKWEFLWKFQAALDKFSMHSSSLLPVPAHQSFPESSQERMRGWEWQKLTLITS